MRVRLNGEDKDVEGGLSLTGLLGSLGLAPEGIAVALNMEVVPRGAYGKTRLEEGDEIEIVRAVGGG